MKRFSIMLLISLLVPNVTWGAQLQVGVFSDKKNVERRIELIQSLGYDVRRQRTAGKLTRVRTVNLNKDRIERLKTRLNERGIEFVIIGSEPEPNYRKSDDKKPDLPVDLPPIRGYKRSLSDTFMSRLQSVLGTDYVWGADSPSEGFDCSGLIHWLYREKSPRTVKTMWPWVKKIDRNQLQPGDYVFFTFDSYETPDHVGLYLGEAEFVHASSSYGVIKADLRKGYYQRHLYGFGRPNF